jgi:hypothetical protein
MGHGTERLIAAKAGPEEAFRVRGKIDTPRVGDVIEIVIDEKSPVGATVKHKKQQHDREREPEQHHSIRSIQRLYPILRKPNLIGSGILNTLGSKKWLLILVSVCGFRIATVYTQLPFFDPCFNELFPVTGLVRSARGRSNHICSFFRKRWR